jgi:hypothetical protein
MLIVVAIVAVIAAIGIGALMMAPQIARIRGTEALIAKIDVKLSQRLDEFDRKRANILPIAADTALSGGHPNRARVIAAIRAMRQEFPDMFYLEPQRIGDGVNNDLDFNATGGPLLDEPDEIIAGPWNPVDVDGDTILDQSRPELSALSISRLHYFERAFADPEGNRVDPRTGVARLFRDAHSPVTARAECLFMIVTAGGSDAGEFTPEEMRDTDGDGLMEFVDRFGNPIQFFLWPAYYTSPMQDPGAEVDPDDPHQLLTEQTSSNSDWWELQPPASSFFLRNAFEALYHPVSHFSLPQPKGFRKVPLIVSAGPDQGFGFRMDPAFVGPDGIMGTLDDTGPIGWMLSVGADGTVGTGDDGAPPFSNRPVRNSPAMRILDPSVLGYGMDQDNIDNHSLRAR